MILKCDLKIKGVPGEKLIAISSIDVRFLPVPFGIINFSIFASEEAMAANDPLDVGSMDVTSFDSGLANASLIAAVETLRLGRFPEASAVP